MPVTRPAGSPSTPGCPSTPSRTADVLIEVDGRPDHRGDAADGGRPPPASTTPTRSLPGLTLPGLANAHSHAFHRALRGRTHGGRGDFWTWREQMYAVAGPARPGHLPRAGPGRLRRDGAGRDHLRRRVPLPAPRPGRRRRTPTRTRWARRWSRPPREAGIRITLLDTCYLTSSVDGAAARRAAAPLRRRRRGRAGPSGSTAFAADGPHARVGAAVHSVRAVPADQLRTVADWARERRRRCTCTCPSSPPRTTPAGPCTGARPTALLADARRARAGHHRRARHPPRPSARPDRCSATAGPACASARPPSGTSPTASARPGRWPTRASR